MTETPQLEKLARKTPIQPNRFGEWIDKALGQSYAHLKSLQREQFDDECAKHLSDVIHHLGELKERYDQLIPF